MRKILILCLLFLVGFEFLAYGVETGPANSVLRVPSGGGRARFGAVNLAASNATTGQLPISKGGTGVGTCSDGSVLYSDGSQLVCDTSRLAFDRVNRRLGVNKASPAFTLDVAGDAKVTGLSVSGTSVSTTYSALSTDDFIAANASGGAFTVTLPTAVGRAGKVYFVVKTDTSANAVTVTSAVNVNGSQSSALLRLRGDGVTLVSDGSVWQAIASPSPSGVFGRFAGAQITCDSSSFASNHTPQTWISSVNNFNASNCTVNLQPGFSTASAPVCTASGTVNAGGGFGQILAVVQTTTSTVQIFCQRQDGSNCPTGYVANLVCVTAR